MTARNRKIVVIVASVAVLAGLLAVPALLAQKLPAGKPTAACNMTAGKCRAACQVQVPRLADALKAIDAASKAVETGEKDTALAELGKARRLVAATHAAMAGPRFINARCPMMGRPIDPAKVPPGLTRRHKGAEVAFCCGGRRKRSRIRGWVGRSSS